jgi:hypothetical protein
VGVMSWRAPENALHGGGQRDAGIGGGAIRQQITLPAALHKVAPGTTALAVVGIALPPRLETS